MYKNYTFIFITLLLLVFTNSSSFSQSYPTDKGSILLGGEFAFNSDGGDLFENQDGDRITRIETEFPFAYFITPGLGVGGNFQLSRTSQGDWSSTEWGIGPQLMYFFNGNKLSTTVKGSTYPYIRAIFLYSKASSGSESNKSEWTGTLLDLGGGIVHMLSENVGLVGSVSYQLLNFKPEEGDSESGNRITVGIGFSFFLY